MSFHKDLKKGFTLIELLIVIGIIAVLAAIVLVAVDPAKRFAQARDARRWAEVYSILNAVLNYMADHQGIAPAGIDTDPNTSQILGTAASGCNVSCSPAGTTVSACLDLRSDLVTEYIAKMPVDPKGTNGTYTYDDSRTGYYINKTGLGRITVGSCNPETFTSIWALR